MAQPRDINNYFKIAGRILRIGLTLFALVWLLDWALLGYFDRPNLLLRNQTASISAMPYLLEDYHDHQGRRVAFLGSSVIAGNLYTLPQEAAPYLVERRLRGEYGMTNLRAFNLAVPGITMGDCYLLLSSLADDPPDLVVLTINVKFFCSYVVDAAAIRYSRLWGLARPKERDCAAARSGFSRRQRFESLLGNSIARRWAMPRLLPLYNEIIFGRQNPLNTALAGNVLSASAPDLVEPAGSPDFLRQPDRWRRLEPGRVDLLRTVYEQIVPVEENSNFFFLEQVLELLGREQIPAVVYITPLNSEFNNQSGLLDPTAYEQFKRQIAVMVEGRGIGLLDLSDAVPGQWFGDLDHLLYPGHRILAQRLAGPIAAKLTQ
ncbi:MAG: hypothetical protein P9M14_13320 [Candidatus Alcyoniella australis]|nr:hypothetical protein [Candidatus Alcyoniella australis]